ncbi:DinB/UmuC family translesion DNA polymerase [Methylorubrum populi]|uniref:DinB/UmuC family translesion DNA polymerase n=1 Tax=Methylorubrum populi TaxID=223967 RepID=UPI003F65883A
MRLTIGTSDTARLIRAALWGLRGIYKPGFRYKKCGILLLDLHPAEAEQGSLGSFAGEGEILR